MAIILDFTFKVSIMPIKVPKWDFSVILLVFVDTFCNKTCYTLDLHVVKGRMNFPNIALELGFKLRIMKKQEPTVPVGSEAFVR